MKRKQLLIALAIAFQIGVVASLAISREWILENGTPYMFQTAPVDPRDIFRGDYVRLDYLFSRMPVEQLEEAITENGLRKGQKVYLSLKRDRNGIARGGRLYASPPENGPYLMGRSRHHWPFRNFFKMSPEQRKGFNIRPVSVKYGIEQYYIEQGSGRAIEEMRGGRNDFQLPMLIHVRVSGAGEAVIHSYEWADIAAKTEVVRSAGRDAPDDQAGAEVRFTLKNRANHPITLPLKPGNCSFVLIGVREAPEGATAFVGERSECAGAKALPVTLDPGEEYPISFDLNRPIWRVPYNDKLTPPGRLPWDYRYRITYQGETTANIKGRILSRAFHGRGSID
ncbi:MAG: GDYXXLXY domain-containing protein [Pseudomonadota bacterium]